MTQTRNLTLVAFGLIAIYAFIIGFTDNYVVVIAQNAGLWQFHLTRSVMVAGMLALVALIWSVRIRPRRWKGVIARSAIHGLAMVIYFGALGYLDVALVAAGLFTAPIWVLIINRVSYGRAISPLQGLAVGLGFCGVLLVLGPSALSGASLPAVLPVIAGAMYAMGNIATREWCEGESAVTIVAGFFGALGVIGLTGMLVLGALGTEVPTGSEYFLFRGPVWPDQTFWFWTFVQAAGSLLGVGLMIRAYQITEAARASVMEYLILPASAFWTYAIWDKGLGWTEAAGMVLIAAAGITVALVGASKAEPAA
jgi:drug/metabolite transporter (DMT)-like permease